MPKNVYAATALTGGGAGALDAIDGTALADQDMAIVGVLSGTTVTYYVYSLDADSAVAESSPGVISPDANAGNKRWLLAAQIPVDEDDMASDSAIMVPSQQSVKAYVDSGTVTMTNKTLTSPKINEDVEVTATATEINNIADDIAVTAAELNVAVPSIMSRSRFLYNGGAAAYTVKAGTGYYYVKDKVARWTGNLTTNAIAAPAASTWYYLYLDYSGITSATAITATELIWSSTAPTYSYTYGGYYNGDDLCIFAVKTNSGPTNILEFFHDGGDLVMWSDIQTVASGQDIGTSFEDVPAALVIPGFATRSVATLYGYYVDADTTLFWRTNGQTGTTGHHVLRVHTGNTRAYATVDVISDSSGLIEWKESSPSSTPYAVYTNGWYFPGGM